MSARALPSAAVDLPAQPEGRPWPTATWATGEQASGDAERVADLFGQAFDPGAVDVLGEHRALLAVQGGRIVAERYAPGLDATTAHLSWSVAKSITHAAAGLLVARGLLDPEAPVDAPEWQEPGDPRRDIRT